jgi:tRNA-binding protein
MNPAPVKSDITIADVAKIDVRVGEILRVDDIPKSRKLVRLEVDFGNEVRTVVVGMKLERPDPSALKGHQALFIVNLPPRELGGIVSEAMLFDIGYADGITPVLALPETRVPNGARAG